MDGKATTHFSLEERKRIEQLLHRGLSIRKCAAMTGRSASGLKKEIGQYRRLHPQTPQYTAEVAHLDSLNRKSAKHHKLKRPVTPQQDELIRASVSQNIPFVAIKALTGLSYQKLAEYMRSNALKYSAAFERSLYERVETLEQQVSILIDQLRELKRG